VHVRGTVTHQEPGHVLWIRDSSGALAIQTAQGDPLRPGDQIDVLGFPKYGSYTPALEDAVFRKFGRIDAPVPVVITNPAAAFEHQADLVSVIATLKEIQPIPDGLLLAMEAEGAAFKAALKRQAHDITSAQYQPGSVVRVTGICSVSGDEAGPVVSGIWRPQTFQILLRSAADVAVIRAPPWWTPRRLVFALLIVSGGSVVVTGVVMWLARRHLREQAQRRAMAEAEFAAILSERNRVAREIHDTLAQGLAATSVQLRLAKKNANGSPEPLVHHLDVAQQLVRDSLEEARNSIWNMRSHILEHNDLAGALRGILSQMADGTELEVNFETCGRVRRFSPVVENNLLRIGQEAIANAAKHARAKHILVSLDFGEKRFGLVVADDGKGFDCSKPTPRMGGFGLVGMRERAADSGGNLEITSVADRGTRVNLSLPISGD
jgi:signal transduction histidine kinase